MQGKGHGRSGQVEKVEHSMRWVQGGAWRNGCTEKRMCREGVCGVAGKLY